MIPTLPFFRKGRKEDSDLSSVRDGERPSEGTVGLGRSKGPGKRPEGIEEYVLR